MGVIRMSRTHEVRHVTIGHGTIVVRVNNDLVEQVMAAKAIERERARRRQFEASIAA